MLRFLDAGESHGKALVAILEGFPANVNINIDRVNKELSRRQSGYGRGKRMSIEKDRVEILSGVRGGKTTGSPITLIIYNRDYDNWKDIMDINTEYPEKIVIPRPGHADLNGALKYNLNDIRNVIERASARETAIRVAVGAFCRELLRPFGVKIVSRVVQIGNVKDSIFCDLNDERVYDIIEKSPVRCFGREEENEMIAEIERASACGDSIGGAVRLCAYNIPHGLGSYSHYDKRMDGKLAGALMSIQGVKAVEIGEGLEASKSMGSRVNDEVVIEDGIFKRDTNYSGGIEGGITNGMPVSSSIYMKPIPTVKKSLRTVDLNGFQRESRYERSDVCVIPSLGVVCENVAAYEFAKAFLEKFSGDSIEDIENSYSWYLNRISRG